MQIVGGGSLVFAKTDICFADTIRVINAKTAVIGGGMKNSIKQSEPIQNREISQENF